MTTRSIRRTLRPSPSRITGTLLGRTATAITMTAATLLLAATATLSTATTADAAAHHGHRHHGHHRSLPFKAPTNFDAVSATCKSAGGDKVIITVRWKVTGGRYANYGNPATNQDMRLLSNVWRGGARYVETSQTWWGDAPQQGEPITTQFLFQQMVAPIGTANYYDGARNIERYPTITFTC